MNSFERFLSAADRVMNADVRHQKGLKACKNLVLGTLFTLSDFIPIVGQVDNAAKVVRFLEKRGVTFGRVSEVARILDSSPDFEIGGCMGWAVSGLAVLLPLEGVNLAGQTVHDIREHGAAVYGDGLKAFGLVLQMMRSNQPRQTLSMPEPSFA